MIPWLSHCHDEFFTAYDPPRALTVATALAPHISYSAHPWAPVPSPTLDPKARQTVGVKASVPVPASVPTLDEPKATVTAASTPSKQKVSDPGPQPNDPATQKSASSELGSIGQVLKNNPQQGSDSDKSSGNKGHAIKEEDPKLDNNSNQLDGDPVSNQHTKSIPQDLSKQSSEVNPFNDFTEGSTKTINDQVIQPLSHGISIAGTTLTPGARPITVSGTPIHFGPSALFIGTSTVPFVPEYPNPDPLITIIAGHVITAAAPDAIAIAGTTLTPGASPITVSGTPIHLASSALLIVGTSTIPLAPPASPTQIITTIAGQLVTAAPSALTIPGTTLSPGSPGVKVLGTLISLDTARHQLIVGTKTIPLDPASGKYPIVTEIGGRVITAFPVKIAIASTTLTPGASGLVLGGTRISLNTAGQVIVGSKTIALLQSGRSTGLVMEGLASEGLADPLVTSVNGQPITAALVFASTTLTPGAPALIINGTLVSLDTAAQSLVVGSKTIPLDESAGSAGPFITSLPNHTTLSMEKGNVSTAAGGADGNGNGNGTSTSVQVLQGTAAALSVGWNHVTASLAMVMAMAIVIPIYIY